MIPLNLHYKMNLKITTTTKKSDVFEQIATALKRENFDVTTQDETRPWGGYFVINESQASIFVAKFFPHFDIANIKITSKLSLKILVVAPKMRFSWQYHFRRAEIWKILNGIVGVKTCLTDEEGELQELVPGTFIQINSGERHRLIGLNTWAIVAEIWQHTSTEKPSDEEDIVRLQDDFGR